jgi:putative glutamine amidotransferase
VRVNDTGRLASLATRNDGPARPLVAATATTETIRGLLRARLNAAYVTAIEGAGLLPLVSAPLADPTLAHDLLARIDGLVLTGGEDVDPRHYGAARHPATEDAHEARDQWELALVAVAREHGIPVLAICRGMQLLNVALGGTLVQDIPSERPSELVHADSAKRARRIHRIECAADSRMAESVGATSLAVNSSHHQSVDTIAPELRVTATAPDGIVEGIETRDGGWWVVGAQWHPEELVSTPEPWDRNLFTAFAREVRRFAASGRSMRAGVSRRTRTRTTR